MSSVRLSAQAIFCLSEAINKLHEAARLVEAPLSEDIRELADEIEFVKREGVKE